MSAASWINFSSTSWLTTFDPRPSMFKAAREVKFSIVPLTIASQFGFIQRRTASSSGLIVFSLQTGQFSGI